MPARKFKRRTHEEVEIRLFELELAALLQALDDGVLELELADEPQPIGEAVREEQDEAVEIENRRDRFVRRLVQVELHIAGNRTRRRSRSGRARGGLRGRRDRCGLAVRGRQPGRER